MALRNRNVCIDSSQLMDQSLLTKYCIMPICDMYEVLFIDMRPLPASTTLPGMTSSPESDPIMHELCNIAQYNLAEDEDTNMAKKTK